MTIQNFEDQYTPPETAMYAYHKSTASVGDEPAREWCCVQGSIHNSDNDAIEAAQKSYGGSWLMPVFTKRPTDWPTNPKKSASGLKKQSANTVNG